MSVSAVSSSSSTLYVAPPAAPTVNAAALAGTAASLSEDAGVVATLSGATPGAVPSAQQLYDNLASQAIAAPSSGASSIDLNSQWASVIKSDPSLAPLSAQLSANQAIVDTFA